MNFNSGHLGQDWTILIFVAEGIAEEHVLNLLVVNNKLIDNFKTRLPWQSLIENMDGKDNISLEKVMTKTEVEYNELKKTHFIVIGDDITNQNVRLDKTSKDKELLTDLYGNDYNDRITYITMTPTTEVLLLEPLGLLDEYEKSSHNSVIDFLCKVHGYSKKEIKSRKFWEENIDVDSLLESIKKIKTPPNKTKHNKLNVVSLDKIINY